MNDLSESNQNMRVKFISALNRDPASPKLWKALLDHVREHNPRSEQAPGRDRLFRKAQQLIPESSMEPENCEIWLNYVQEIDAAGDKVILFMVVC
jgi:hypothetical protein